MFDFLVKKFLWYFSKLIHLNAKLLAVYILRCTNGLIYGLIY